MGWEVGRKGRGRKAAAFRLQWLRRTFPGFLAHPVKGHLASLSNRSSSVMPINVYPHDACPCSEHGGPQGCPRKW
jgi:hypothetical protein